jgi:hypothetical protein
MKLIQTRQYYTKVARCKGKGDLSPNPFAICHTTVDKDKNPKKYDRCVNEVSEKAEKKDVRKKPKKKADISFEEEITKMSNKKS